MNIFINTISSKWKIILFNNDKNIISQIELNFKKNEASKLLPAITKILKQNNLNYNNLENIVVVNGPWSFTWIRSTILIVNSINFIIKKNITTLNFFDLFNKYPIVKSSSKRDSFFKKDKNTKIEIIENSKLKNFLEKNNIKKIYWEIDKNLFENFEIIDNIDYENILKNITFMSLKKAESNYIKKPSIT